VALSDEEIRALAEPVATDLGLELWDVQLRGSAPRCVLRVFLDRPGEQAGVTVADCEAVSRRLSDIIDTYDAIDGHYLLEVSSPGINRQLNRVEHFERVIGSRVKVRRREDDGKVAELAGILKAFDGTTLQVEGADGHIRALDFATVVDARTEFDFEQDSRHSGHAGSKGR